MPRKNYEAVRSWALQMPDGKLLGWADDMEAIATGVTDKGEAIVRVRLIREGDYQSLVKRLRELEGK